MKPKLQCKLSSRKIFSDMSPVQFPPPIDNCDFKLVGGCVRDILMGVKPKDLDFIVLTQLKFPQLVKIFEQIGTVFQAKEEFLTIRCCINHVIYDFSLPRSEEQYLDGRHPSSVKRGTLIEDASRRDFTINSLYLDKNGIVTDYFDGYIDIQYKILDTVGNPYERFSEDYLRILRGIRFSLLGFEIKPSVFIAMRECSFGLSKISTDRIREEINKCLLINPARTMKNLDMLNILPILEKKKLHFFMSNKKVYKAVRK